MSFLVCPEVWPSLLSANPYIQSNTILVCLSVCLSVCCIWSNLRAPFVGCNHSVKRIWIVKFVAHPLLWSCVCTVDSHNYDLWTLITLLVKLLVAVVVEDAYPIVALELLECVQCSLCVPTFFLQYWHFNVKMYTDDIRCMQNRKMDFYLAKNNFVCILHICDLDVRFLHFPPD